MTDLTNDFVEDDVVDILFFFDQFQQIVQLRRDSELLIDRRATKYLRLSTQIIVLDGDSFDQRIHRVSQFQHLRSSHRFPNRRRNLLEPPLSQSIHLQRRKDSDMIEMVFSNSGVFPTRVNECHSKKNRAILTRRILRSE